MSYELEIQRSLPSVFNALDGTVSPLAAGSGSASLISTTPTTVDWNAWTQLREGSPFTVELWYLPVNVTGETIVAGHLTEGLIFNGTDFILRINYSDGTTLEGRWTPTEVRSWHIALVYDRSHFLVYVNGDVVISLDTLDDVTWTETQAAISLNRVLNGAGTGVYDALTLYYRSLTATEVRAHYMMGKSAMDSQAISTAHGASVFELTYRNVDVYEKIDFDLSAGRMNNVAFSDALRASDATGGTWMVAVPLASLAGSTTAGVHLTYVGTGITLAYSLDGVNWTDTPNKRTILEDTIPPEMFYLRLTLVDDESWASTFRADILGSRTMEPINGSRALTFIGAAFDQTPATQLDYQLDQGAQLSNHGYMSVGSDPSATPTTVGTIEMWVKVEPATDYSTILDGNAWLAIDASNIYWGGASAVYIDGVARSQGNWTIGDQVWHHVVVVASAVSNNPISIGTDTTRSNFAAMSIGSLAVYPQQLTAAQAAEIYNVNIGAPAARIYDSGVIGMTETVPTVDIYAYSWSIISSGA